ncbi:hypothetical protein OM076_21310 [Solirubrobacter ginsenosidimutans]|uniref:Uncharacterized protein n=1 Tax=Solirubrobacter ginsenosidimutans TaxID=490573 RepID=A0A9X3S473_9ACTN|nr:hypothetical protein [Solirubrobacter ginsenosidimutans]
MPARKHVFKFGVGFQVTLGTHTVTLEPESAELDQLLEGTGKYALPDGEEVEIGSLADGWADLRKFAPQLPELPTLPDPLDNIENAPITIRALKVAFVKKELDQLVVNVSLQTDWKVPVLEAVKVDRLMFLIDYQATS